MGSNVTEIEDAIEQLPDQQIDQLAIWFDSFRQRRSQRLTADQWLQSARGSAIPGALTDEIMSLTRGEE